MNKGRHIINKRNRGRWIHILRTSQWVNYDTFALRGKKNNNKKTQSQSLLFAQLQLRFSNTVFILAPVSSLCMYMHTRLSVCSALNVCRYMCRRVWVCLCVCWSKSVNIVLCSSNSSSSDSPVAAHSAVYFPSWRTTSYQISRHCLLACCPTMRSQRISRPPFSSRLSYSGASAHSWWLTTRWTTHTAVRLCELYQQWLVVSQLTSREVDVPDAVGWADPGLTYALSVSPEIPT